TSAALCALSMCSKARRAVAATVQLTRPTASTIVITKMASSCVWKVMVVPVISRLDVDCWYGLLVLLVAILFLCLCYRFLVGEIVELCASFFVVCVLWCRVPWVVGYLGV